MSEETRGALMYSKVKALLGSSKPIEPEDARECMEFMFMLLNSAAKECLTLKAKIELISGVILPLMENHGMPKNLTSALRLLLDDDAALVTEEEYAAYKAEEALKHGTSSTVH